MECAKVKEQCHNKMESQERNHSIADILHDTDSVRIGVLGFKHDGKVETHRHRCYEFVYVDKGFTLHMAEGTTTVLTGGDLFVVQPGIFHSYTGAYHTEVYNIIFDPEELGSLKEEVMSLPGLDCLRCAEETETVCSGDVTPDTAPVLRVDIALRQDMVRLLDTMKRERECRNPGWEQNLKGQLICFLVFYSRIYQQHQIHDGRTDGYHGYICRALRFIEENYQNDIGGKEVAECIGLSQDYVSKQFKQALSMSPSEYIRRFRVAKAMELLKDTDLPASEIAYKVGFGDLSLFSRVFKRMCGISPSDFRRGMKV